MRIALGVCVVLCMVVPAYAADHVRVILDISQSMRKNDPGRLAILSALLLHDLANPDATRGDSFEVIPFDPALRTRWTASTPPPTTTGSRIAGTAATRETFARTLAALDYSAGLTYFYPGLAAAITDLESGRRDVGDRRVVVLVTDGVPEPESRDEEARRLREELVPRFRAAGARLYVLAFGPQAVAERAYFESLVSRDVGEAFAVDATAAGVPQTMIQIFSRSFGYTATQPVSLGASVPLNLEGGQTPTEVAVVAYQTSNERVPFELRPAPNSPRGVQRGQERGAAYAMQWVLQPQVAPYTLASAAGSGTITVLRPARLRITVRPGRPGIDTGVTIARTRFPLQAIVSPLTGASGDPGEVNLAYSVCLPGAVGCGNPAPPTSATGTPQPDGRAYAIEPVFPLDPEPTAEFYRGAIHIVASRGDAIIGELRHPVAVYPFVSLAATPPVLTIPSNRLSLDSGERGCADFSLTLAAGRLPHPDNPVYSVRAALPSGFASDPRFAGAIVTVDGEPVDIEGQPRPKPGRWLAGWSLDRDALLGNHTLCVQVGRTNAGDPVAAAEFELKFALGDVPYGGYSLLEQPLRPGVLIAPPGWLERLGSGLALTLALAALVGMLWYGRDRPYVAGDLRCVLEPAGTGPASAPPGNALAPASPVRTLLGLTTPQPIVSPTGNVLGQIRPVDRDLFEFRPMHGVQLVGGDDSLPNTVQAHRTYDLRTDEGTFTFRVEYS